jgi:Tol biopolymer transport system component
VARMFRFLRGVLLSSVALAACAILLRGFILGGPAQLVMHTGRYERFRSGGSFRGGKPAVSPNGKWILYSSPRSGEGDIFAYSLVTRETKLLIGSPKFDGDVSFSQDGSRIVFLREEGGVGQVWTADASGNDQRQITHTSTDYASPIFLPGGNHILCARRKRLSIMYEVVVIDAGGKEPTVHEDLPAAPCNISVGTRSWAYASDRDASVYVTRRDGSTPRAVGTGWSPALSPDGKLVAVLGGDEGNVIELLAADGSSRRRLDSTHTSKSGLAFMPSGTELLYLEEPGVGGLGWIQSIRIETGQSRRVTSTL